MRLTPDFTTACYPERVMSPLRPNQGVSDFVQDGISQNNLVEVLGVKARKLNKGTFPRDVAEARCPFTTIKAKGPAGQTVLGHKRTSEFLYIRQSHDVAPGVWPGGIHVTV